MQRPKKVCKYLKSVGLSGIYDLHTKISISTKSQQQQQQLCVNTKECWHKSQHKSKNKIICLAIEAVFSHSHTHTHTYDYSYKILPLCVFPFTF